MQTRNYISTFGSLMLIWLAFTITGCTSESFDDKESAGDYYLQLHLNTMTGSRAGDPLHPWGGEEGDGTEAARNHENEINDITLFIYNGTGVNDPATTPIKKTYYFNNLKLTETSGTYKTSPLPITNYTKTTNDRVIILINMGDKSGLTTLGAVRDEMVNTAWHTNGNIIKNYNYFAMSSAIDDATKGKLDFSTTGKYSDPFKVSVDVERVAARIDFWFHGNGTTTTDGVKYEATDESGTLYLTHVRIVNASEAPTYTLKRTSPAANPVGTLTYLGDETVATDTHIPNNYVIEPNTQYKHLGVLVAPAKLNSWYGESSLESSKSVDFIAPSAYKIHNPSDGDVFSVTESYDIDGDGTAEGTIKAYTLGYVMENTMDKTGQNSAFMTGLQFKGTFVPKKVYKWNGSDKEEVTTYTKGADFWYYENITTPANSFFFTDKTSLEAYAAANYTDDYNERKYVKGECYYYVWIRHAMFDGTHSSSTFPMEYGIVRNNIYRIGVKSVSKVGPEEPTPEDEPFIFSHIYVRKWRLRKHPEIVL